uniref:Uncharacterized protein n=1 Tax=Romanomermis culicivorax TaxID=13658 RepID=A0A915J2X2_ROMCU
MDWALEVVGQLESMSLIHSSSITHTMQAVWSMDSAKKYLHLLWALLSEWFEVEALTAPDVVLTEPVVLRVLGPEVARRAIEFISNCTIWATPVDKLLLEGEPWSPAVNAIHHGLKQASPIPQPAPPIAVLPQRMMTSVQMLSSIA